MEPTIMEDDVRAEIASETEELSDFELEFDRERLGDVLEVVHRS
ncbi:hypothetical protein OHT76_05650 [Streptomyces sp. NBC_00287]|nr:hypothetical protein [Streptomyces sp. NBC_00287]